MSLRPLALLGTLAALVAAGCITPNAADLQTASAGLGLDLSAAPESLWLDPENAPHPAFNWPTLVNPAQGEGVSPYWAPIPAAQLPASIAGVEHLVQVEGVKTGAGISLFGSLAVVPGFGDFSYIVDISDPAAPKLLSEFEPSEGSHRGSAIIAYPDGRLVAVFSTGPGFEVYDITDPTMPAHLANVEPTNGGHKLGVVPGTPYVYNANSNGGGMPPASLRAETGEGITEIYDLTDPAAPRHVQDFPNGFGCHHIYFWQNAEKQRAICAGIEYAQIWDIADPENPVVLTNVPIPHGNPMLPSPSVFPVVTPFAHFSILNTDGTVLIVGDELGGGGLPPGCTAPGAPTGALWFYDVKDETNPKLLGWFSPGIALDNPPQGPFYSCTAHHGRLVPDPEGRDLLAMSFYRAGVVLIDFSDPTMAKIVDQFAEGTNTWETWYYNGYLFTGDLTRGMDVLSFV